MLDFTTPVNHSSRSNLSGKLGTNTVTDFHLDSPRRVHTIYPNSDTKGSVLREHLNHSHNLAIPISRRRYARFDEMVSITRISCRLFRFRAIRLPRKLANTLLTVSPGVSWPASRRSAWLSGATGCLEERGGARGSETDSFRASTRRH